MTDDEQPRERLRLQLYDLRIRVGIEIGSGNASPGVSRRAMPLLLGIVGFDSPGHQVAGCRAPKHLAEFALHSTAANILLLAEAAGMTDSKWRGGWAAGAGYCGRV